MIKRIVFGGTATDARAADAAHDVRPLRAAVCTALPGVLDSEPKHDNVTLEWFADPAHLERFEAWLDASDPRAVDAPTVVADELVLRGADWLEQRWRDGGPKLKHMALATRPSELSAAEFSGRWRTQAGAVTRGGTRTEIPVEARGLAYVQNHPRSRAAGEWAYDADFLTEVEVVFVSDGPDRTRVELEHRGLDAYGDQAPAMREQFESPGGWRGLLEAFAAAASALRAD